MALTRWQPRWSDDDSLTVRHTGVQTTGPLGKTGMKRMRTTLAAGAVSLLPVVFLAGCGSPVHSSAKPSKTSVSPAHRGGWGGLSLERLESLTNYRSQMTSGMGNYHMTVDTSVHSPTDWQVDSGATTRYVNGMRYIYAPFGKYWLAQTGSPDAYAQQNLPSFARQFFDMTRVSGVSLRHGKPCRQAGVDGHVWSVAADGGAAVREAFATNRMAMEYLASKVERPPAPTRP